MYNEKSIQQLKEYFKFKLQEERKREYYYFKDYQKKDFSKMML